MPSPELAVIGIAELRDEIDSALNWISIDSPIARALVGKSIDDEVKVKTPAGDRCLVITEIKY